MSDSKYMEITDKIQSAKFNQTFNELIKTYVEEHLKILKVLQMTEKFFSPFMLILLFWAMFYTVFISFVLFVVRIL